MHKWNNPYGIWDNKDLSTSEKAFLQAISMFANIDTGEAYPSNKKLSDITGLHISSIKRVKSALTRKNYIKCESESGKRCVITLNLHPETKRVHNARGLTMSQGVAHDEPGRGLTVSQGGLTMRHEHIYNISNEHTNNFYGKPLTNKKGDLLMKGNQFVSDTVKGVSDKLKKHAFVKPETWSVQQLKLLWSHEFCETYPDTVCPIPSVADSNFFKIQVGKVGADVVAEAIPVVIREWAYFIRECKSNGISYAPSIPKLGFFTRYMPEAINFSTSRSQVVEDWGNGSVESSDSFIVEDWDNSKTTTKNFDKFFNPMGEADMFCVPIDDCGNAYWEENGVKFKRTNGTYHILDEKGKSKFWVPRSEMMSVNDILETIKCKYLPIDAEQLIKVYHDSN